MERHAPALCWGNAPRPSEPELNPLRPPKPRARVMILDCDRRNRLPGSAGRRALHQHGRRVIHSAAAAKDRPRAGGGRAGAHGDGAPRRSRHRSVTRGPSRPRATRWTRPGRLAEPERHHGRGRGVARSRGLGAQLAAALATLDSRLARCPDGNVQGRLGGSAASREASNQQKMLLVDVATFDGKVEVLDALLAIPGSASEDFVECARRVAR